MRVRVGSMLAGSFGVAGVATFGDEAVTGFSIGFGVGIGLTAGLNCLGVDVRLPSTPSMPEICLVMVAAFPAFRLPERSRPALWIPVVPAFARPWWRTAIAHLVAPTPVPDSVSSIPCGPAP